MNCPIRVLKKVTSVFHNVLYYVKDSNSLYFLLVQTKVFLK